MDPIARANFMGAAGAGGITLPAIGDSFEGGYYAGLISHTADGNATHALIVAPKASGGGGNYYTGAGSIDLSTDTTTVYGNTSEYDGAYNSALIVASNSPIMTFINGLSIGGYTDWYLPALMELKIAFYNLKPTTANNTTAGGGFYGSNPYAVPPRTGAWGAQDPAQTSVTAFQWNNSEAFYGGSSSGSNRVIGWHWTSTQRTTTAESYFIDFNYLPGQVDWDPRNRSSRGVRPSFVAFRRVAL